MSDWRPGAPLSVQRQRAILLAELRQYFHRLGVMEVETPLLCQYGVTDPGLDNFAVVCGDGERWLQTSPEYAMKRLLAAGSGDIFQICKAFRSGELGQRHNPEYTLLEWYRLGVDHYDLLHQVGELVCGLLGRAGWQVWPWGTLAQHVLGSDIERATLRELEQLALAQVGAIPPALDREALLDLLVSHCVEPALATWGVVFVVDYPLPQAALARRVQGPDGEPLGARFECYVDGLELANGYWECGDADELALRFESDNLLREQRGLPRRPVDQRLLAALQSGLPDCSGVAMGLDRLLALQSASPDLDGVLAFNWTRS